MTNHHDGWQINLENGHEDAPVPPPEEVSRALEALRDNMVKSVESVHAAQRALEAGILLAHRAGMSTHILAVTTGLTLKDVEKAVGVNADDLPDGHASAP